MTENVVVNRIQALMVRLLLFLHFLLVLWRVSVAWGEMRWLLACAIVPFLLETVLNICKWKGIEWKWVSLCFLFYSGATVPGIWLLEIKRTETYLTANVTSLDGIPIPGLNIPLLLSSDTWALVAEEMLLYLMTLSRWILPLGHLNREKLSQLLFAFLGMASDIMDIFSLFESDNIRADMNMTYTLLAVWSWSVLQFSLTFYTVHHPQRAQGVANAAAAPDTSDTKQELAATLVSLFMQDGPFLVLRMYAVVVYKIITHSMIFFVSKNIVVICLLLYKIIILCHVSREKGNGNTDSERIVSKDVELAVFDNPLTSVSDERQTEESSDEETDNPLTSVSDERQTEESSDEETDNPLTSVSDERQSEESSDEETDNPLTSVSDERQTEESSDEETDDIKQE